LYASAPSAIVDLLQQLGLTDVAEIKARASTALLRLSQRLAPHILNVGQYLVSFSVSLFVMLYMLFFLLRDGGEAVRHITESVPMRPEHTRTLFEQFAAVVRAAIKSNLLIAVLQGALGALIFALLGIPSAALWGVVMAILSLLPVVGAIL